MRGRLFVLFVALDLALAGLLPAPPAGAAAVSVLTIEGKGWGHGVGMSQYGARWMAEDGATSAQILQHFYPGTSIGTGRGPVRVAVHAVASATVLAFPNGGEVRGTGEGFPMGVAPGGQVRVAFEGGAYRVDRLVTAQSAGGAAVRAQVPTIPTVPTTSTTRPGSTSTTTTRPLLPTVAPPSSATTAPRASTSSTIDASGSSTTAAPGEPPPTQVAPGTGVTSSTPPVAVPAANGVVGVPERGRQYRGVIHATAAAGPLRLVNEVDVEEYLRGLGEMPASWPQAAQEAQSIVARTYALRAMTVGGDLCDYARCQVYIGRLAEHPNKDRAVAASRGQVVGYDGRLATAVYASNHGGISATTLEGFGTPDGRYPYLRPVRYTSRDPFPWSVDVSLTDFARRIGYRGTIATVTITERGPSGRPLGVTVSGDAGDLNVTGLQITRGLGLKSNLWEVRIGQAEVAPPPPPEPDPEAGVIQALPDDAQALSAASRETADSIELEETRQRAAAPELPGRDGGRSSRSGPIALAVVVLAVAAVAVAKTAKSGRSASHSDGERPDFGGSGVD